jgi:hypothetical protein
VLDYPIRDLNRCGVSSRPMNVCGFPVPTSNGTLGAVAKVVRTDTRLLVSVDTRFVPENTVGR